MRSVLWGVGLPSDAGGLSSEEPMLLTQLCQRGVGVRPESTLFLVGDNLASSHWSRWRGEVHKRRRGLECKTIKVL